MRKLLLLALVTSLLGVAACKQNQETAPAAPQASASEAAPSEAASPAAMGSSAASEAASPAASASP